jgi:hypothetical protein
VPSWQKLWSRRVNGLLGGLRHREQAGLHALGGALQWLPAGCWHVKSCPPARLPTHLCPFGAVGGRSGLPAAHRAAAAAAVGLKGAPTAAAATLAA